MSIKEELEELQLDLIKDFKKSLKDGDASSTDKSNMIKMFKDNGIYLKEEVGENPFADLLKSDAFKEIILARNSKKTKEEEIGEVFDAQLIGSK